MKKTTIIILVILGVFALWILSGYNTLVSSREAYTSQWAQVENQYQRRFDLIPNLVATVKGATKQELAVFGEIADARTRYSGVSANPTATQADRVNATANVESALGRLLVITENYPELKSLETMKDLTVSLEGTENRTAVERQKYNDAIRAYNLHVQRIPGSLIARIFGFDIAPYFEAAAGSEKPVQVEL